MKMSIKVNNVKEKEKNDMIYINIFSPKIAFRFFGKTYLIYQFERCHLVVTPYK